ncbi:C-type mannose receptor 2 [Gasterosteus aculeatus]
MIVSFHTEASVSSNRANMQSSLFVLILMGECSFCLDRLYEYHFVEKKKTWNEAQKYCREKHTDLATVYDMEDVKRLMENMEGLCDSAESQSKAWIGLRKQTSGPMTWHWSLPGEKFNDSETQWKEGQPDNTQDPENCVVNRNGEWLNFPCTVECEFICYDDTEPTRFHLIEQNKTWLVAQSICRENYTDLVSGSKQLYDSEFTILPKTDKDLWIGLFRDTWKWSDKSSSSFRHWDQISEQDDNSDEGRDEDQKCATVSDGKLSSDDCDGEHPFVCYDDEVILIRVNKTWEEALDYCREHHRELASVTDCHQQAQVQQRAKRANTPYVWMGLRYTCTLGFWFWLTDEVVDYKNWNSTTEVDGCDMSGAMETGGGHKWFKKSARKEFNFICLRR